MADNSLLQYLNSLLRKTWTSTLSSGLSLGKSLWFWLDHGNWQSSKVFAGKHGFITLRDLFRWANRFWMFSEKETPEDLGRDGYYLLAERLRDDKEKQVVLEVLQNQLRIELPRSALYKEYISLPDRWYILINVVDEGEPAGSTALGAATTVGTRETTHVEGLKNGNDCQGQGSSGQRRSTKTLPPLPLCATCGKPHPGVCYKATGGCFTCGSTQHKVKDCPQGKQKQSMSTDLARLPPTIGRVYATTRVKPA
nr:midasin isoform X14 [Tanacetum cinerariifolium]